MRSTITQEKVIRFIEKEQGTLRQLKDPIAIIGSAALLLSNVHFRQVNEMEMLVSSTDFDKLKVLWNDHIQDESHLENGKKFLSRYTHFQHDGMSVEVMADLFLRVDNRWKRVALGNTRPLQCDGITVHYQAPDESFEMLNLLDREKDHGRLTMIEHTYSSN